jgi:hypothetical protein
MVLVEHSYGRIVIKDRGSRATSAELACRSLTRPHVHTRQCAVSTVQAAHAGYVIPFQARA